MKISWKADQRADGDVNLQIQHEDGEVERVIFTVPTSGLTDEILQKAVRQIVFTRRAQLNHGRLRERLKKLEVNLSRELEERLDHDQPVAPPPLAELFVSFLAPKHSAQVLLGDLQEMFQKNAERYGEKQARRKYWIEVARSFGPLLWQWLKRIGLFTFLIDYFRSKFGL